MRRLEQIWLGSLYNFSRQRHYVGASPVVRGIGGDPFSVSSSTLVVLVETENAGVAELEFAAFAPGAVFELETGFAFVGAVLRDNQAPLAIYVREIAPQ